MRRALQCGRSEGTFPFKDIHSGDVVLSRDETGTIHPKRVTQTFEHEATDVIDLSVVDQGHEEQIFVTSGHPFSMAGAWTRADALRPGDGFP